MRNKGRYVPPRHYQLCGEALGVSTVKTDRRRWCLERSIEQRETNQSTRLVGVARPDLPVGAEAATAIESKLLQAAGVVRFP